MKLDEFFNIRNSKEFECRGIKFRIREANVYGMPCYIPDKFKCIIQSKFNGGTNLLYSINSNIDGIINADEFVNKIYRIAFLTTEKIPFIFTEKENERLFSFYNDDHSEVDKLRYLLAQSLNFTSENQIELMCIDTDFEDLEFAYCGFMDFEEFLVLMNSEFGSNQTISDIRFV